MNNNGRDPSCFVIIGTNGTGKTVYAKQLVDIALQQKRKALIIVPDLAHWRDVPVIQPEVLSKFKSGKRLLVYEPGIFADVYENFSDGIIICDDFQAFDFDTKDERRALRKFLIRRRQNKYDVTLIAHGATDIVPLFIWNYTSHLVIFQTLDNIARIKHVLRKPHLIERIINEVNEKAGKIKPVNYMSYHKQIKLMK